MKPRRILDSVVTRDGTELVLYQHGDSFQIDIDGYDLMSSRAHGSEEELARLSLSQLDPERHPTPHILVGGLGMGFTLRAALDGLDTFSRSAAAESTVTVAEVFPAVVEWNRTYFGHLARHPLDDPRTQVRVADVQDLLPAPDDKPGSKLGNKPKREPDSQPKSEPATLYDVILLDVDNGPSALTLDGNERLYLPGGLQRLRRALRPGGLLSVWSASHDARFLDRLQRAGFDAKTYRVRARAGGKGDRHTLFLGRR